MIRASETRLTHANHEITWACTLVSRTGLFTGNLRVRVDSLASLSERERGIQFHWTRDWTRNSKLWMRHRESASATRLVGVAVDSLASRFIYIHPKEPYIYTQKSPIYWSRLLLKTMTCLPVSFQKSLIYTPKRALYTPKRALYTPKRALYTYQDSLASL